MTNDLWFLFVTFVSCRYSYHVLNVWHVIYDHYYSWLCLPEINIWHFMFDIPSMMIVIYVCVLQRWKSCPYWSTYHLWSCFSCLCPPEIHTVSLMFDISSVIIALHVCVFQSHIYRVLIVWHIIYDLNFLCVCLPAFNSVSLLFGISLMTIVVYVCVFQRYIPCP